jgi:serine/threonine-protein kinase
MAIVYQVEHNQLGSQHALKVLTIASRQIKERLLLEGRAQATLRHPNVVTVTDVVDIGGSPGLIMEYIEGPSLDDYLEADQLSIEQVDHLARGILAGVAAAHDAGLVHRDLKPANIMLSIATGGLQPKVTDFGLAKIVAQGDKSKTRTGSTMGTPHYMSPEQIDDSKNVGPATDIWALGAILYEMLCGERAFPGDNLLAIFSAVNKGEYIPIEERVPGVPERMAKAIASALDRDIDKRPASVQALYAMWTGDEQMAMASAPPMGPWDAGAISNARSIASGAKGTWSDEGPPQSGETLADGGSKSDSMLSSRAAWIGVGGTFVGLGALAIALLAVGLAGAGAYYAWNLQPQVVEVQVPVDRVVEVPVVVPGAPIPSDEEAPTGTPALDRTPAPQSAPATAAAPPPDAGSDAPLDEPPPIEEAPAVADADLDAAPDPTEEPTPEAPDDDEEVDTGAAPDEADGTAAVEPVPEPVNEDGVYMGQLHAADPNERIASIRRKVGSADEDTSKALFNVLRNDQNGKVRMEALGALMTLWDEARGHWTTNNNAMVYAMGQASVMALPATDCYGRNGQDPNGLLTALKHSDPNVRKSAIDAAESVLPRAPAEFDRRGFIEPYTTDPDTSVAKKAQRLLKNL